jgi:hypothetical protein
MPVDLKYEDLKLSYGAGNILQVGRSVLPSGMQEAMCAGHQRLTQMEHTNPTLLDSLFHTCPRDQW